jgi:Fe2+ or Zn2+ uptake regulation protein
MVSVGRDLYHGCLATVVAQGATVKTPIELTQLFRDRSLKVTGQRLCIFRILHDNGSPPTAHSVFPSASEEIPTISLRTVYQTLSDTVALGEIQQFDVGTGAARFDPATGAHHHLACTRCGAMRDVHCDLAGVRLQARQHQGFTVSGAEVIFRGLCAKCSQVTSHQKKAATEREDQHV